MSSRLTQRSTLWVMLLGLLACASTGCSSLSLPAFKAPSVPLPGLSDASGDPSYSGLEGQTLSASMTAESYQKIKQAKAQNAVVLQVQGDSVPVRLLPLPDGSRSVFVSELLEQTGLQSRLGSRTQAVLHRPSPDSLTGIKMEIELNDNGEGIATACDYALRPGDRIVISKAETTGAQELVNMVLRR
ncbi:hypothetical protein [Stieleria varia]|uniref:Uncharacterized protein n=1 Tax=Stieleria varia TaxID=2528005 RepID=A0A5C6B9Z5_9BACT|nr:hypothetical protein [Stieleria varia]TWU08547.1 hypothetical protein Pla52n_11300 [Stieleria varia]